MKIRLKQLIKEHSMLYPTISEYVKAIQDAGNNLDKLAHLTPVLDNHREPYHMSDALP